MPIRTDYAKINIACKELGICKRDIIFDRYGLTTSKDLSDKQLSDLLAHFRRQGWRPAVTVKNGRHGSITKSGNYIKVPPGPAARQQKYVLKMWNALGYSVANLHARAKKQFGVDRFEWITEHADLHILITDLQERCRRAGIDPENM